MSNRQPRDFAVPDILLLDVETSGLPIDALPYDDDGQPWAPQMAAALCTPNGTMINFFSNIIKAEGREIKQGALAVHGITKSATSQVGTQEQRNLGMLLDYLAVAGPLKVVTFTKFDGKILTSLFARFAGKQGKAHNAYARRWAEKTHVEFIDLQKPYCQQACKIETDFDDGSFKWPTLEEAADILLGLPPRDGFHDAFEDLLTLRALYFYALASGALVGYQPAPPETKLPKKMTGRAIFEYRLNEVRVRSHTQRAEIGGLIRQNRQTRAEIQRMEKALAKSMRALEE